MQGGTADVHPPQPAGRVVPYRAFAHGGGGRDVEHLHAAIIVLCSGMATLLRTRRFLPLFVTQALGALNDNLFKNAMVILIVFRAGEAGGTTLAAVAGGVFILPFALFGALAGQAADRFDKARLIRISKAAELVLMLCAAAALPSGNVVALMAVLFGLGVQAAAFGPLKYGILPQLLAPGELLAGNAFIEAATFGAILAGTIAGGLLIGIPHGPALVGAAVLAIALAGLAAAWAIPPTQAAAPGLRIGWNVGAETKSLLRTAHADPAIWRAVLGLSWFWALGATYLAVFPALARDVFGADNRVVTLLLTGFAVGVGLGSLAANRLLRGEVSLRYAGRASFVLSLGTLAAAALCLGPWARHWTTPAALLTSPPGLAAWACLLLASAAGGVFSLPLYATLQRAAAPEARARIVAANNVMNAAFMVADAAVVTGLTAAGLGPASVLMLAGTLNLVVAWRFRRSLDQR